MARLKLSDAQQEQLKVMIKEGKKADDIVAFFKTTYQIDLPAHCVYAAKTKLKVAGGGGFKTHKKYSRAKKDPDQQESIEQVLEDICKILVQIGSGYKRVFVHLRSELVKSRAEVHAIQRGAKIEIPAEEEDGL